MYFSIGQAEDIRVEASQIMRIRNNIVKLYSVMTGQTSEQIILDLDRYTVPYHHHLTPCPSYSLTLRRDNFMSAEDALKYGLIDEIVQPNDDKIKAMSLPPPGQAPELFGDVPEDSEDYEFGKLNIPKGGNRVRSGGSYRR
jgi:hypothetical protein